MQLFDNELKDAWIVSIILAPLPGNDNDFISIKEEWNFEIKTFSQIYCNECNCVCRLHSTNVHHSCCFVIMHTIYFVPILSTILVVVFYLHWSTIVNTVNIIDFTLTFVHSSIQMNYLWIALKRAMDQYKMKWERKKRTQIHKQRTKMQEVKIKANRRK